MISESPVPQINSRKVSNQLFWPIVLSSCIILTQQCRHSRHADLRKSCHRQLQLYKFFFGLLMYDFHIHAREYREPSEGLLIHLCKRNVCYTYWPRLNEECLEIFNKKQPQKPTDVTTFTAYQYTQNIHETIYSKQNTKINTILRLILLQISSITPISNVGVNLNELIASLWWNLKR